MDDFIILNILVTEKNGEFWTVRKVDFFFLFWAIQGKSYFKAHHYSPTIIKSEANYIIGLYVMNNSILMRSELVIDKPLS